MAVYVSADWHIDHKNILKYCNRPFYTVKDHDNHIVAAINKCVQPGDTLYFLGDMLFANEKYYEQNLVDLLNNINCRDIRWCRGNHDPNLYRMNHLKYSADSLLDAFDYKEVNVNNKFVVMSHYAFVTWNKSHRGAYHFYGHTHSTMEDELDIKFPGRLSMDVGIDNAKKILGEYRPFELSEATKYLDEKRARINDLVKIGEQDE